MLKTFEWVAIIAAVVLILSLVGVSYLSSPPPGNPREQQSAAQAEHENQTQKQHSLHGFIRFLFPDGIAVFTFFLVLATILLGWVAIVQNGFLERAERIAATSADAAKDAAKAGKRSADYLANVEPAYLFLNHTSLIGEAAKHPDNPPTTNNRTIIYGFKNYGKTPAVITAIAVDARPDKIPTRSELDGLPNNTFVGDLIAGAGDLSH